MQNYLLENAGQTFQNGTMLIRFLVFNFCYFFLIGIVHVSLKEYRTLLSLKIKGDVKQLKPLKKYLIYFAGGALLFFGGFFILNIIESLTASPDTVLTKSVFLDYLVSLAGILGTILFQFAGIALTISAGNRWIVTIAKIIFAFTVVVLIAINVIWQLF